MGYKKQALKGITWTWILRFVTRMFSFLRVAIIARVLTPSLFGIYGIAELTLASIEVFTESGINVIIIQENKKIDDIVDTAWIFSILRGFVIFLVIFISAPFVASFFNAPKAAFYISLISISPLIRGFINPASVLFQKELQFQKEFYYRASLFILESLSAIFFVVLLKDPVGIIYGLIIGAVAEVILSFVVIKPTPRFNFDKQKFREIFSRGKWLTLSGIFNYLYHNADNAMVGRFLGTTALGFYDMAYSISMLPITEIGDTISKVILPVYTKISGDKARLKKAFNKTLFGMALFTIPVGIIFFVFAKEIVLIVLGENWLEAVPVFRVLAVFGVVRTILNAPYSLFYSLKKQEYTVVTTFVSFIVMIATIIPLMQKWGLVGAGIAVVLGSIAVVPITAWYLVKVFKNPLL
jgi:O-antigen/teichoic acid export membrane protein